MTPIDASENANGKEVISHKVNFSDDEIAKMKTEHTEQCIEMDTIEETILAVKMLHAERMKELKQLSKSTRKKVKQGFHYIQKECYLVPNFTTGMMQYCEVETGDVIMERKLYPDERQMKLIPKTGTNDNS